LKEALIKILQDFQLQISLLEGCQTILTGDGSQLTRKLQKDQAGGFFLTGKTSIPQLIDRPLINELSTAKALCPICARPLQENPQGLLLLFLCRHVVHASCAMPSDVLPSLPDPALRAMETASRGFSGKIAL
jgi:vacuolar protein sorting-associated protein 41